MSKTFRQNFTKNAQDFFDILKQKILSTKQSKYVQPEAEPLSFETGFIFIPLQVPHDSVMQLSRLDIFDVINALMSETTLKQKVVIKRQPKDQSDIMTKRLAKLKINHPNIIFSDENIHTLLSHCSLVITVNSGVGAEALLYTKPVITLGASDYDFAAYPLMHIEDLPQIITQATAAAETDRFERTVKNYLWQFYTKNSFHINQEVMPELWHHSY